MTGPHEAECPLCGDAQGVCGCNVQPCPDCESVTCTWGRECPECGAHTGNTYRCPTVPDALCADCYRDSYLS